MAEESKREVEMDMQAANSLPMSSQIAQIQQMYQMSQMSQVPYPHMTPQISQQSMAPFICCPYLMSLRCPMMQYQGMYWHGASMGHPRMEYLDFTAYPYTEANPYSICGPDDLP